MNAIYARQSVDRADSISIESQISFCRYEAKEEACKLYIDRGYSGKNTDRPSFQAMLADMRAGLIQKVIVYKLDRISRSILDFSNLMEIFEKYRVEFVSTTEKFDTASPMGRAMLNICIVFAQLERETIQKRVTDAYFTRSQKSLYMGGRIPYGYRLAPTVVGTVKTSMYVPVPDEAQVIQRMYELYARPEYSYGDLVRYFQAQCITKRGKPWVRTRMAEILRNPIYVRADQSVYQFYAQQGVDIVNAPSDFIGSNGCYYYRGKNSNGSYLVLAPHEGIVPSELWLACRRKCLTARQLRPGAKAKNTWLAGKIKCGICGYALVDKHYAHSSARYLLCSHHMQSKACPGPGTLYTDAIEEIIRRELEKKLALFPQLSIRQTAEADPEQIAWQTGLAQVEREMASLLARLACADDVMYRYLSRQISTLDQRKQALMQKLGQQTRHCEVRSNPICRHPDMWESLSFEDKRRIADLLIRVIHVTRDTIQIEWRI